MAGRDILGESSALAVDGSTERITDRSADFAAHPVVLSGRSGGLDARSGRYATIGAWGSPVRMPK
jgi:hypothetical protein